MAEILRARITEGALVPGTRLSEEHIGAADCPPAVLAAIEAAPAEGERAAAERRWFDVGTANMQFQFHQAITGLAASPRIEEIMRQSAPAPR